MEAGFETVFGDLMFALGIGKPIRTLKGVRRLARLLMPIAGRLPLSMIYPTGESQNKNTPKWEKWYAWADVIAGDCNYITKYAPLDLHNKIIVTNTTTPRDREFFKERGVSYLITTTPELGGRTFGTNALEAAFVAAAGKGRPLESHELEEAIKSMNITPTLHKL